MPEIHNGDAASPFSEVFLDLRFDWWGNVIELIHNYNHEISKFARLPDPSVRAPVWPLPITFRTPYDPRYDGYADLTYSP